MARVFNVPRDDAPFCWKCDGGLGRNEFIMPDGLCHSCRTKERNAEWQLEVGGKNNG